MKSASSASDALRLNSSSARHVSRTASVPRLEAFEPGQELLSLRAEARAADALFRLARGEIDSLDQRLLPLLRLDTAGLCCREQNRRRAGRVELRIEVDGPRGRDQRLAPRHNLGIEKATRAVEPAARRSRERPDFRLAPLGRLRCDPLTHCRL
jgi:hypothetical protein